MSGTNSVAPNTVFAVGRVRSMQTLTGIIKYKIVIGSPSSGDLIVRIAHRLFGCIPLAGEDIEHRGAGGEG
jgi:hypothetical protein